MKHAPEPKAKLSRVRGRLTDFEKQEIVRLADTLQNPTPSRIAHRLNRNQGTVYWYMIRNGLITGRPLDSSGRKTEYRDGRKRFSLEEDKRLVELRSQNWKFKDIARQLTEEFGILRNGHSCHVRCVAVEAYHGASE